MLCTLVLLLFVVLNVLQCEGNNRTQLHRPKRWLRDDVIKSLILKNEMEKKKQNSKFRSGGCTNLYESILKDIDDISFSKKAEIENNEVMPHPYLECRESCDKDIENDPLMTKFYTFSKVNADEPKPFTWIDLLTVPIVQSLVKPKDTDILLKNMATSPSVDKFHIEELNNNQGNFKKEIDDASFNNILQFFASLGNKNSDKNSDRETEIRYSNQVSSNNDAMEEKLSPSCLVENKSNYFKTGHGPYNKVLIGSGAMELLGRVNAALGNFSSNKGRFEKTNNLVTNNLSSLNKENIPDVSTFPKNQYPKMIGQYKSFRWPDIRNHRMNIYNFSKTSPAMDRANMPRKIEMISKTKNNNYFDVLSDINLDEQAINASLPFSYSENVKLNSNDTYLKNNYPSSSMEVPPSLLQISRNNDLNINGTASNNNINHVNLQNLINSPGTLEKICLLDKIINSNKFTELNKFSNYSSGSNALSPLDHNTIKYNHIDNKSDMRNLSNYILSHKLLNFNKIKPENKTVIQSPDTELKSNICNTNTANAGLHSDSIINKTVPAIMSIGEQLLMPTDVKPGTQKIILPEYEKMDGVEDSSQYSQLIISSTDLKYESMSTTAALPIENTLDYTSELPLTSHADPMNTLHRNMIPVIDFLGQMWNNTNRKNQGASLKNLETEFGGYVIVPLPENSMLKGWKHLEKTPALGKDAEFRDSGIVSGLTNGSISQLMTPSNRDLLEKFILKRLFDSFRESLVPKRRTRRSKPILEDVEDSHSQDFSSTTSIPTNSTQLPPTDKWTMNSSARPGYSNTSTACQ